MDKIRILSFGEGLPAVDSNQPEWLNRRILVTAVQHEPIVETRVENRRELVPYKENVFVDRTVMVPAPAPTPRKPSPASSMTTPTMSPMSVACGPRA